MLTNTKNILISNAIGALMLSGASCKKDGPDMNLSIPVPAAITFTDLKAEKATMNWTYADERARKFVIEVSKNQNYAAPDSFVTTAAEKTVLLDSLESKITYYVRMRALADDPLYHSRYATATFVSAEIESIFLPVDRKDIQATSAVLKWSAPKTGSVSKLVIIPQGGSSSNVTLSAGDISARQTTLTGLQPVTAYRVEIWGGDERKGITTFTTKDPNARITINNNPTNYDLLQDAVNAAVSGDVIKFGPAAYDFSDPANAVIVIDNKSLTLEAEDPAAAVKPAITMTTFNLKGNIGQLKVSGLKIISKSGNTDYLKHIFGGTYATGAVNLVLENCDFSGAVAGLFFTQTVGASTAPEPIPGTGNFELSINNCLLHDFGNSGGDFIDFRSGTIVKVHMKNSTIWAAARSFYRVDATANAAVGNTMLFENNTFNAVANGAAFIRVAAAGCNVQLTKNIITNKPSSNNNSVSGTGTTLKYTDNNVFGTNAASITSAVTTGFNIGTTNLDPQYTNAAQGNFTVGNATVKTAAVGDPRWL